MARRPGDAGGAGEADRASGSATSRRGPRLAAATTLARSSEPNTKLLGDDPKQWAWGKLHTATFRHPLAGLGTATRRRSTWGRSAAAATV